MFYDGMTIGLFVMDIYELLSFAATRLRPVQSHAHHPTFNTDTNFILTATSSPPASHRCQRCPLCDDIIAVVILVCTSTLIPSQWTFPLLTPSLSPLNLNG
jgi:hypothetical protein